MLKYEIEERKTMGNRRIETFKGADLSGLKAPCIAVYKNPEDYPGRCVARVFDLDKPTQIVMVKKTLAEIDRDIRRNTGKLFIPRMAEDVTSLVGVYIT